MPYLRTKNSKMIKIDHISQFLPRFFSLVLGLRKLYAAQITKKTGFLELKLSPNQKSGVNIFCLGREQFFLNTKKNRNF